jgi:EVE domain-containing protein
MGRLEGNMRYWINTVSREHVHLGVAGGFTQANHGRLSGVRRLELGDLVAFYSPRTSYPDGEPLRRFTAIGEVVDLEPYQVEMTPSFHPWRRNLQFVRADETAIEPLLDSLTFITDRQHWGFVFRRGLFEIGAEDFQRIAQAMHAPIDDATAGR